MWPAALASIFFAFVAVLSTGLILSPGAPGHAATEAGKPSAPSFVFSADCAECHPKEHAAWSTSHHSWALRLPTPENILGDFKEAVFEHQDAQSHFFKRGGKYYIKTDGPDGKLTEFEIKYTVGVEPLQQYLVQTEKGRLQALDIAWDTEQKRWFHLYPDQKLKPGDGLHWTGPYKNWQSRCAECHQTNFVKGYSPKAKNYRSQWSELTIGCEACHGPGAAHVQWAKDPAGFRSHKPEGVDEKGLTVTIDPQAPQTEIRLCARCHSRRSPLSADSPPPGSRFGDHYRLALLREGLYHADGQIDDEVYVYGSFLQSKMYERGVRCSNCHEPHSGKLEAEGNAVCTQCHSPAGNAGFPTLKKTTYDDPSHHHHEAGSQGAKCANCHMPAKTYMQVDPRRDHSFRVPRPDLSVKLGIPTACTGCHDDKSAQWATARLKDWFPDGRTGQPHYGETLHLGRARPSPETGEKLVELALDESQPAIVRATALDLLRPSLSADFLERVSPLLGEKNDLLRSAGLRLYQAASPQLRAKTALSMLDDPVRSVRQEAAQLLLGAPLEGLSDAEKTTVQRESAAYQSSLFARTDFPEIQMQIAGLAMVLKNFGAAQGALKEALAMDLQLADAWITLARIQSALRRPDQAIETLESATKAVPDNGNVFLHLGSFYAQQRKYRQAVSALEKGLELSGPSPDLLDTLAVSHLGAGDLDKARKYADQLVKAYPDHRASPLVNQVLKIPK